MRRRWLWVPACGVVLIAILAGTAALLPPGTPFEFLQGRAPVNVVATSHDQKRLDRYGVHYTIYSFRANFTTVEKAARTELTPLGYKATVGMGHPDRIFAFFRRGRVGPVGPGGTPKPTDDYSSVNVYRDVRKVDGSGPAIHPGKDPGWVTVLIMKKRDPSPFARLKEWLGL